MSDKLPASHLPFKRTKKLTLAPAVRQSVTEEYAASYREQRTESDEDFTNRLSVKLSSTLVKDFQAALGGFIQQEARRLATTTAADALQVRAFLDANPLPPELAAHLSTEYRIFSLLMNTAKQFISREQAHTDSHVLGAGYKKRAKAAFGTCLVTHAPLLDDVQWHHVLRDGRPPIPLTKAGHEKVDASKRQQMLDNDPIYRVLSTVKSQEAQQKRFYSWSQLGRECRKSSNGAWRRTAKQALQEAGLPCQDSDILDWLDDNALILSRSH